MLLEPGAARQNEISGVLRPLTRQRVVLGDPLGPDNVRQGNSSKKKSGTPLLRVNLRFVPVKTKIKLDDATVKFSQP